MVTHKEKEIGLMKIGLNSLSRQSQFDYMVDVLDEVRQDTLLEVKKLIDEWDFYELREELRLFAFDDDKDYVSEFKKRLALRLGV